MIQNVLSILKEFEGERFGASFEWPANCDGFNEQLCPEMKQLRRYLPLTTVVDGCATDYRILRQAYPCGNRGGSSPTARASSKS
jgi:hypothetical protein